MDETFIMRAVNALAAGVSLEECRSVLVAEGLDEGDVYLVLRAAQVFLGDFSGAGRQP